MLRITRRQASKHVPPTFVAGHHSVTDQERAGSSVIGNHPQRNIIAFGLSIPGTGQFLAVFRMLRVVSIS